MVAFRKHTLLLIGDGRQLRILPAFGAADQKPRDLSGLFGKVAQTIDLFIHPPRQIAYLQSHHRCLKQIFRSKSKGPETIVRCVALWIFHIPDPAAVTSCTAL